MSDIHTSRLCVQTINSQFGPLTSVSIVFGLITLNDLSLGSSFRTPHPWPLVIYTASSIFFTQALDRQGSHLSADPT